MIGLIGALEFRGLDPGRGFESPITQSRRGGCARQTAQVRLSSDQDAFCHAPATWFAARIGSSI
jgi:hypothetical protein